MKTVELFCGTKSFSRFMRRNGHETFTVDINPIFNPDCIVDILSEKDEDYFHLKLIEEKMKEADIIWMSLPCTTFSMASGNTHWTKERKPRTKEAIIGLNLLRKCIKISERYKDKIFFIENPVARARWFMPINNRHTIWYCQYGDKRAKPTDIWTNLPNWNHKSCKNNNPNCHHERAPRGSKTGTQGLKDSKERSIIPEDLFKELIEVYNDNCR